MRSLRFAWKQRKAISVLWMLDILFFAILFACSWQWLCATSGGGYFAFRFNLFYFLGMAQSSPVAIMAPALLLLFLGLYLLFRLFFLGSLFDTLHRGYPGLPAFLGAGAAHFFRFLLSFIIYFIPGLIVMMILMALLGRMLQSTDHIRTMEILTLLQQYILFLAYCFFSYLCSLSRFAMVREGRFKLSLRTSGKRLLAFWSYSTLGLLLLAAAAYFVLDLLLKRGTVMLLAALLLYLAALFLRTLFQVAAYKSADNQ